jgi:hypothetical protein
LNSIWTRTSSWFLPFSTTRTRAGSMSAPCKPSLLNPQPFLSLHCEYQLRMQYDCTARSRKLDSRARKLPSLRIQLSIWHQHYMSRFSDFVQKPRSPLNLHGRYTS